MKDVTRKMKDRFTYKGKKAYFGVADLRDGQIEQVVNYKTAKDWDCHHSFMFRKALVCKIDDGVCVTFWIEGNQIWNWSIDIPYKIKSKIEEQITIIREDKNE